MENEHLRPRALDDRALGGQTRIELKAREAAEVTERTVHRAARRDVRPLAPARERVDAHDRVEPLPFEDIEVRRAP